MINISKRQVNFIFLLAGIIAALFLFYFNPFYLEPKASKTLAIAGLMIIWWMTEALPLPVTALLPLVFFPLLGIATPGETASPYANPIIFLFMGGFMLGLAIEKWNLHRRIALNIVKQTGTSGDRIILGFILATGLLSMWLSNTATTMMMFPIALSVIHVIRENNNGKEGNLNNFSLVLMLVVAYAANLGGIATIIGTPPNVAFAGIIKARYNYSIGFVDWFLLAMPLSLLLLFTLYIVMTKILFPNKMKADNATRKLIRDEIIQLGPMGTEEKRVLIIFACTAFLWITRELINKLSFIQSAGIKLDDTIIAMMGALALFICPASNKNSLSKNILEWGDTQKMAWGILILFGGGISLASAMERAGLIEAVGVWMAQFGGNGFLLVLIVTFVSLFLGELMSNIAQVIVFGPVICSMADAMGINPLIVGIPMTLGASCAGMFPMATPPNAIVFSSGYIPLNKMIKAGFVMNIIAVVLITLFCWFLLPHLIRM